MSSGRSIRRCAPSSTAPRRCLTRRSRCWRSSSRTKASPASSAATRAESRRVAQAAALSARRHIVWLDEPFDRVLTVMPAMYAGSVDGRQGRLQDGAGGRRWRRGRRLCAARARSEPRPRPRPRRDRLSLPRLLPGAVGTLRQYPGGILAHSTHVKGRGTFDARAPGRGAAHQGHARHRHPARALRASQPGLSGSRATSISPTGPTEPGSRRCIVPRAGELLFRVGQPPDAAEVTHVKYAMGVVGLGVMGANLARNIESRGFPVAGYDLDRAKTKAFVNGPARARRRRRRQPAAADGRCSSGRGAS